MAKDSSFDVVSEVDFQEVDNAYQQTTKEMVQRYDLKGSGAELEYDKSGHSVTLLSPSDFIATQVKDILISKLVRRAVDPLAVSWSSPVAASGSMIRITGTIISGIDEDTIKKINKEIKAQKFKAKTQIEGEKIRVSSASRDELQNVITFLKEADFGIPLQFTNYR